MFALSHPYKGKGIAPYSAGGAQSYSEKVLALSPLAYYKFADTGGTTAKDSSGNGLDGTYSGVTLGAAGIGDGNTAVTLNGATGYIGIGALAPAFNANAGTLSVWAQVSGAGVWADGTYRVIARLVVNSNNEIQIRRTSTNNQIEMIFVAGGAYQTSVTTTSSATGWIHFAVTWDKAANKIRAWMNGAQVGTDAVYTSTWTGTPSASLCGAFSTANQYVWNGNLAHAALFGRALNSAEIADLADI